MDLAVVLLNIHSFSFAVNQITGPIPPSIFQYLQVGNISSFVNKLTGDVPYSEKLQKLNYIQQILGVGEGMI